MRQTNQRREEQKSGSCKKYSKTSYIKHKKKINEKGRKKYQERKKLIEEENRRAIKEYEKGCKLNDKIHHL